MQQDVTAFLGGLKKVFLDPIFGASDSYCE
jgi:hypothetical protein